MAYVAMHSKKVKRKDGSVVKRTWYMVQESVRVKGKVITRYLGYIPARKTVEKENVAVFSLEQKKDMLEKVLEKKAEGFTVACRKLKKSWAVYWYEK